MAQNVNIVIAEAGGTETNLRKGQATAANSLPVVLASDQSALSVSAAAQTGSWTDRSGSITAGGTSQQLMAANGSRKAWWVQNISTEDMWIGIGVTAAADSTSLRLSPGDSYYEPGGGFLSTQVVNVVSATTGSKFVAKEA